MLFDKPVAVITGAASGIGLALCKVCLLDGMRVIMADNVPELLSDKAAELRKSYPNDVFEVVCDVSKLTDVEHLAQQSFERCGRVDILVNNAGISGPFAPIWELSTELIRRVIDVNLYGVIHGVKSFLPELFKQTHPSHIVNMASVYGLCSASQISAYAMSKQAVVALSESLYFDLQRMNKPVNVSVVCPSYTNTQLLANSNPSSADKLHQMMRQLIECGRPAEEVAEHIVREVRKNTFYILPDKEVKGYCEQRLQAILHQTPPTSHTLEKIIATLSKRAADLCESAES